MRIAILLSAAVLHAAPCTGAEPETFLLRQAGLHLNPPLARPSARMLPPAAANEVAAAGVVEIRATIGAFLERFRDIKTFKRTAEVESIGLFSELPEARQQELLVKAKRFQRSQSSKEIAANAAYLGEYAPRLLTVLSGAPAPEGVEQFVYWSREKLVSKPVLTVTEVSIFHDKSRNRAFILTRQIFAEHHFQASLGVTALFETPRGLCLVYLNRSRSAFFSGPFSAMRRSIASTFIVSAMERKLAETRDRFEPVAMVH
jgi:hypothetical protein